MGHDLPGFCSPLDTRGKPLAAVVTNTSGAREPLSADARAVSRVPGSPRQVSSLSLPLAKLVAVYEQLVLELLEMRELDVAR